MCQTKICTKCGEEKVLSEYNVGSYRKDGSARYRSVCKVCYRNSVREYRANKDYKTLSETKEYRRQYEKTYIPKGKKTNIKFIKCCDCGVFEVVRQRVKRDNRCLKCHSKYKHDTKYYPIRRVKNHDLIRNCIRCNKEFETLNNKGYCSDECRLDAKREYKKQRRGYRRRAKLYGCYYEPFSRTAIFKRDKWRCKSCGIKVQKKNYLADNAAELDHIVPLSKGGAHTPSNCQTLCRKCNGDKSDRIEPGTQITLYASL